MKADLIILGAGPAGMAAARVAAEQGISVLMLDEQPRAGGQIYRDVARAAPLRGTMLGAEYTAGQALVAALDHPGITHLGGARVWDVTATRVSFVREGRGQVAEGRRLLIATGALERPMPLPGWTLPGVMTAGAAQILMKQSGVVHERAVLVGAGPLLYLVAVQLVRAGMPPMALVETCGLRDAARALGALPRALFGAATLAKGGSLLAELRRAKIMRFRGATDIEVLGDTAAQALRFRQGRHRHRLACDTILLHHGVIPDTRITGALRLPHRWDARQQAFRPVADRWGRVAAGVFVAGDGAGIGGAKAAALRGELAALEIAHDLGALGHDGRDLLSRVPRLKLRLELAPRAFLDRAFPPSRQALAPRDDTLVCRCEEVSAGEIRRAVACGATGPNQAKAFTRAGMGPCQGRYCGPVLTRIIADATGRNEDETGALRNRAPLVPVTLGVLAASARDL
ncbi:NAD(P)/FAD-dependent oxidoreductase [Salipiger sp.]|uniref:FAD/NAD(P)-dependent oxidoreductase n=1 Tax=Salipiger sp. TaxID=2078585 RepID=UPI003A96BC44